MIHVVLLFLMAGQTLCANLSEVHANGASFANSLLGVVQGKAYSTSTSDVPGFETATPPEASLDNGSIGNATITAGHNNEAATYVKDHSSKRQLFKLDPNTEQMFVNANQAILHPEQTLEGIVIETSDGNSDGDEVKFCEEGGDEYLQKCSKHLEIKIRVIPEIKKIETYCCGHPSMSISAERRYNHNQLGWCGGCRSRTVVSQYRKV